jgi:SpoIID/LytB domain protein
MKAPSMRDDRVWPVLTAAEMTHTFRRLGGIARLTLASAVVVGAVAGTAATASQAAPAPTLLIEGAGEGHGVGMSQDGALGLARHGFAYQAILAHYYTGTALGHAPAKAVIRVLVGNRVLRVPLERYVRGVVAAEMPSSWPLPALEAQAVASRTYALTSHAGGSRFDVYSDTRSQVYEGVAAETSRTNQAVAATANQIVTYAGRPAITYFFASSGGVTESIQNSFLGSQPEPWLVGVSDPYESGTSAWRASLRFADAASRLRGLVKGSFRGIEVLRRGVSPRILAALVLGSRGTTPVAGPELAARFGLASTWAYFSVRRGTAVTREPDRSGHAAPGSPPPTPAPPPVPAPAPPVPAAQGGGAQAPSPAVSASTAGGVPAR